MSINDPCLRDKGELWRKRKGAALASSKKTPPSVGGPKRIQAPSALHLSETGYPMSPTFVQLVDRIAVLDGVVAALAVHDVLVSILDPDCVAGRAAIYDVVAAAADQHVLA